jgi:hypothetical protein
MSAVLGLARMKLDGLVSPEYDVASFDFDNCVTPRHYPYIDRDGHDNVGRKSHAGGFKLYFLNSLELESFPQKWDEWKRVLFDGSSKEMIHPLLGPLDVRIISGSVTVEARTTSGVLVEFKWEEDLTDPTADAWDDATNVSVAAAKTEAQASVAAANIPWPSEEAVTDAWDAIAMVESAMYSVDLAIDGMINQAQGKIDELIGFIDAEQNHSYYAAKDALVKLWGAFESLGEKAGVKLSRTIATGTTVGDTTLDELADSTGNSLADLMTLNPTLLGNPIVKSGTAYRYYA